MTTATRVLHPGESVRVPSRSVAGVAYTVALALDGRLLCNCPASYNHLDCWHLKFVREEMTTETAVAIRPISLTTTALIPSEEDIDRVNKAAAMVMSGAVTLPVELKTAQQVAALMLYGLELGLRPMTALRHLYIVKGKVQPSSEVMAGMLMRSDPQAKLIVEKLEVKGTGNDISGVCTMRILRPSRGISQTYTVDWADIKRAGLARDNNLAYPEDRLRYHATKRLLRIYAPDIINAFDDGPSFSSGIEVEGSPAINDEASLYNEGDEPIDAEYRNVVDKETGEIPNDPKPEAPIAPTEHQLARIDGLLKELHQSLQKADWEALNLEAIERFGKEKLAKRSLLTYDEAAELLLYLRRKNGEPVDMPLEDEVPAGAS